METNFFISDTRDPTTGKELGAGTIKLAEHQKRLLRAATGLVDGLFQYSTIIYSAVKKSGKTRVAAGVTAWYASVFGQYNEIYCIANDGKQSSDRLLSAVKQSVQLSKRLAPDSAMAKWRVTKARIELPNGTFIEAIPCDPSGQAGANPGMTAWSELWGYRHEHKERLWSEMTIPPTRWGKAIRWVESYAGYTGESNVLETLWNLGVNGGVRHPAFPNIPVYVNNRARIFCYWDETPRMPWQTKAYYEQEAELLTPDEFRRIHRNQWVNPITKAIPIEWWDACQDIEIDGEPLQALDSRTPVVLSVDASVSHDCCAATLTSRHPKRRRDTATRQVRIWNPPRGGKIDLRATVQEYITNIRSKYNIVEMCYDEYQMAKMATEVRQDLGLKTYAFGQVSERAVADKKYYEMIVQKQTVHNGDPGLREHVDNAASKPSGATGMRFVKMSDKQKRSGHTAKPIDALIAASMGNQRCLHLNLG